MATTRRGVEGLLDRQKNNLPVGQKNLSVGGGQLVRSVEITDTGTATQMANGNVR